MARWRGGRGADAGVDVVATLERLRAEERIDEAVELVSRLRFDELERLEAVELRALAVVLTDDGQVAPDLELRLAHLYDIEARIDERADVLVRLAERAADAGDAALGRAVAAEQARDLARQCDLDAALGLGHATLAATPTTEARTRMRCLAAIGLAEAYGSSPGWSHRGADALREAAMLASALGERHEASEAWLWLGYWVLFRAGSIDESIQVLRRAVDEADAGGRRRGIASTFLAEVLVRVGRADEAERLLDEARALGRSRHDALTLAYDAWMRAEVAVVRRDAPAVATHLAEVEHHRASWWEHSTGTDFLAGAADMHRRLGDADRCRAYLAQAEGRVIGLVPSIAFSRAAFDAALGDPNAGLNALDTLLASDELFAIDRARAALLAAVAAQRAGTPDTGHRRTAVAHAEAALDESGVLALVEPVAVAALGADAVIEAGAAPTAGTAYVISLLGEFSVRAHGQVVELPPGMASTLVKVIAISRSSTVDAALELFWPDDSPEVGRRRLRNLLNRLAVGAPGLVVRRDGALALAPTTETDLERFTASADATLAATWPDVESLVRDALRVCGTGLLPNDRYEDWSVRARERVADSRVRLLEHLADVSDGRADSPTVLWCRAELVDAEPYDEGRYLDLARAALAVGRRELVRATLDRATVLAKDLGVELGAEWAPVRTALRT